MQSRIAGRKSVGSRKHEEIGESMYRYTRKVVRWLYFAFTDETHPM